MEHKIHKEYRRRVWMREEREGRTREWGGGGNHETQDERAVECTHPVAEPDQFASRRTICMGVYRHELD